MRQFPFPQTSQLVNIWPTLEFKQWDPPQDIGQEGTPWVSKEGEEMSEAGRRKCIKRVQFVSFFGVGPET